MGDINMTALDIMISSLAAKIREKKQLLFYNLGDLICELTLASQNLDDTIDDHTEFWPNSRGVIQGKGSEIDNACGRLSEMVSLYKQLKALQDDTLDKAIAENKAGAHVRSD